MFSFKLSIFSPLRSLQNGHRHISVAPGRVLGLFKDKSTTENAEDAAPDVFIDHDEEIFEEVRLKRIEKVRNKSGLLPQHRNILHGQVPYEKSESWVHNTLKYQRKMFGKFGEASKIDPRICFPTPTELKEKLEYERIAFPMKVPEMIAANEEEKQKRLENIRTREENISKNLEKLDQWKKDIEMRREKKETEARVAKERKERLIEEVRRHFGYTIDPRDERFKEMLEAKEKEQRKALKESKRQAKETKLMDKLIATKGEPGSKNTENSSEESENVDSEKK